MQCYCIGAINLGPNVDHDLHCGARLKYRPANARLLSYSSIPHQSPSRGVVRYSGPLSRANLDNQFTLLFKPGAPMPIALQYFPDVFSTSL
jgi:hypothetical protein